jgi:Abortive infection alpha
MTNDIIPVSDEQAKAIQEALKTLQGLGGYMKQTFGTVPQDIVGLLGGDYLKVRRAENLFRMIEKTKKKLEDAHVDRADVPPSLSIPIMIAAADESRDELLDLWAALLAAAADPEKSSWFRIKFIEVVKQLDPLDPLVLQSVAGLRPKYPDLQNLNNISQPLGRTHDEVAVSLANLEAVGLASRVSPRDDSPNYHFVETTPLGRELLRTIGSKS